MQAFGDFVVQFIADGLVIPIVIIAAVAMLRIPRKKWPDLFPRAFLAGILALTLAKIASLIYQGDARPFVLLGEQAKALYVDNPGFPSDHAVFVFAIAFIVWASTKNKQLFAWLFSLSVLVALGRIAALVHAPIDVVGGFVCALVAVIIMYGHKLKPT